MTIQMNVAEAKAKLSELLAKAEAGEEVIIARGGKPIAVLTTPDRVTPRRRKPVFGIWEHLVDGITDSVWSEPDLEVEALMDEPLEPEAREQFRADLEQRFPKDPSLDALATPRRKAS